MADEEYSDDAEHIMGVAKGMVLSMLAAEKCKTKLETASPEDQKRIIAFVNDLDEDDLERADPALNATAACLFTGGGFTAHSLPQDCTPFYEAARSALFEGMSSDRATEFALFKN
eukprot:CAMPEP_0174236858 /NCGR_PEP_ID=MMETSP0417-20130205/6191_1 /TAXON_ID=242541 /ORGANISM="Mayorella sp, Strain BSH-02190019" /LENGTH=114 /DNA_ID=CAMNT_0015315555 /DNA_START=68 /DNA_END=409 /DNA_ORIENTATION=+